MDDREDRIRKRAHEIWIEEGQQDGHGDRHWLQAESEIDAAARPARRKAAPGTKTAAAKPAARGAAARKSARKS